MATQVTTNAGSGYGNVYIDSLIWGNASWSTDEAVNVGFWTGASPVWGGDTSDAWSTSEIFAFEQVLDNYAAVSNLTFNTVTPSESTDISNTTDIIWYQGNNSEFDLSGAFGWHEVPDGSLITQGFGYWIGGYFNIDENSWNNLTQGSYGYLTILHELGHAMGLAHPHDGGGDGDLFPGVTSSGDTGDYALNQGIWTTMTYVGGWTVEPTSTDDYGWQMTLMAFDIAALQVIYGANNSYQTGDNTYTLSTSNGSGVGWECIWDAGGIDTISNAGSNQSSTINLNAAPLTGENAGGYVSWIGGITGGYTIANNVIIENAIGGDGDDVITGNDADNTIYDNAGTNTIDGGLGSDTLVINANYDNAISIVTSLTAVNDQVTTAENTAAANIDVVSNDSYNQTISNSSTFTNTVSNVEYVQFNDQTVSLSLTITAVSADNGSVIVNGDNTLTYTPNTDYSGADTVYYTVSDGLNSSSAEVNVTVINDNVGDNIITVQSDTTSVQAGPGTDTVIFSGNYADYTFSQSDSYVALMTNNATGQVVSLYGVEQLQFDDTVAYLQTIGSGEFQVNTYTAGYQLDPSITALDSGGFVVIWKSYNSGIFAQMYSADGTTQGNEFHVSTHTLGWNEPASITALNNGGFVVTWQSGYNIFAQMYNADGTAQGTEFQVNTYAVGDQ